MNALRAGTGAVVALLAGAGPCAAADGAAVRIAVSGDSVIATGLAAGPATVRVTRPDARTAAPVVIGEYSGTVRGTLPFTVNTTVPNPLFLPDGDCWQAGALKLPDGKGLTPDIRPGDTVHILGGPSMSVPEVVKPSGPRGPIAGCAPRSAFAENAVTHAPAKVANAALAVSGVAQPLARGVSISVSDGVRSTKPVAVAPDANGRWTATIRARQIARLARGKLDVTAVFAVPDVSDGDAAHIAGTPLTVEKVAPARPATSHGRSVRRLQARSVRGYARLQVAARGWTAADWRALELIARYESRWDPCAVYPSAHNCAYAGGGSCGIPQAQPCPAAWRGRLWTTRFAQVRWLVDYIGRRYGDPQRALSFRRSHSYY